MRCAENLEYDIKKLIVETLQLQVAPSEIADDDELFGGTLGFFSCNRRNIDTNKSGNVKDTANLRWSIFKKG